MEHVFPIQSSPSAVGFVIMIAILMINSIVVGIIVIFAATKFSRHLKKISAALIVIPAIFLLILVLLPLYTTSIALSENRISVSTIAFPPISYSIGRENVKNIYIADLSGAGELGLKYRSYGVGMPGYSFGYYELNNGARAFVALTDASGKAVVIELIGREEKLLILQPSDLEGFINALKSLK